VQPRIENPALMIPGVLAAMQKLGAAARRAGVPATTLRLVEVRASQINGCSVCLHMHARDLRKAGETDERLDTVAGWRDTPWFTDAERAALALAEELTRVADRPGAVPDDVWAAVEEHYDEQQRATLVFSIGVINLFNRLNIATRQEAGQGY
jgi:AhpD family alkylhydroperoxidase